MTLHDDILAEADKIIAGDRRVDYGDVTDSFVALASLWTWYLKTKFKVDFELTGIDVAMIMTLMKVSRGTTGAAKRDNLVDICGYAALGARFLAVDKVKSNQEKVEDLILKAVDQTKEAEERLALQKKLDEDTYCEGKYKDEPKQGKKHYFAYVPFKPPFNIKTVEEFRAWADKGQADSRGTNVAVIRYRPKGAMEPLGANFPYMEAWKISYREDPMRLDIFRKEADARNFISGIEDDSLIFGPVRILYEVLP